MGAASHMLHDDNICLARQYTHSSRRRRPLYGQASADSLYRVGKLVPQGLAMSDCGGLDRIGAIFAKGEIGIMSVLRLVWCQKSRSTRSCTCKATVTPEALLYRLPALWRPHMIPGAGRLPSQDESDITYEPTAEGVVGGSPPNRDRPVGQFCLRQTLCCDG
jgi:hypothetical protein